MLRFVFLSFDEGVPVPVRQREEEVGGRAHEVTLSRRPRHARVAADHLARAQLRHGHGRAFPVALGVERGARAAVHRLRVAARPHLLRVLAAVALADPRDDLVPVGGAHEFIEVAASGRIADKTRSRVLEPPGAGLCDVVFGDVPIKKAVPVREPVYFPAVRIKGVGVGGFRIGREGLPPWGCANGLCLRNDGWFALR